MESLVLYLNQEDDPKTYLTEQSVVSMPVSKLSDGELSAESYKYGIEFHQADLSKRNRGRFDFLVNGTYFPPKPKGIKRDSFQKTFLVDKTSPTSATFQFKAQSRYLEQILIELHEKMNGSFFFAGLAKFDFLELRACNESIKDVSVVDEVIWRKDRYAYISGIVTDKYCNTLSEELSSLLKENTINIGKRFIIVVGGFSLAPLPSQTYHKFNDDLVFSINERCSIVNDIWGEVYLVKGT